METSKPKITNKELDTAVNYIVLRLGYNCHICLPYKDGAQIVSLLEKAEMLDGYSGDIKFKDEELEVTFTTLSQREYRKKKMMLLLKGYEDADE